MISYRIGNGVQVSHAAIRGFGRRLRPLKQTQADDAHHGSSERIRPVVAVVAAAVADREHGSPRGIIET